MSIYPVKLSDWYNPSEDEFDNFLICLIICKSTRCLACGKRINYKKAIGHHSLPWGYGDIWCSWKCCKSGKKLERIKEGKEDLEGKIQNFINGPKNIKEQKRLEIKMSTVGFWMLIGIYNMMIVKLKTNKLDWVYLPLGAIGIFGMIDTLMGEL